jgi:hypothetical protein
MRPPLVNYGWNPIESAPFDKDNALQVTDGRGAPYTLQWPCRRTTTGWVDSKKGTLLEVTPVRWRPCRLALNDIPPIPRALARSPSQHVKNIGTFEPSCS